MTFFAGLDLGQAHDYTALCIAERLPATERMTHGLTDEQRADWDWTFADLLDSPHVPTSPATYQIKHLERLPLGTSYPEVVARVQQLTTIPALKELFLAVDAAGAGAPVLDLSMPPRLRCPRIARHIHGRVTVR